MGYATVRHVPRCTDYANAKAIHDGIVPIRGKTPEVRPLGQRRDADEYWTRMDGNVVEFVCYKTPVVRFLPDGDIELNVANWSTVSTHQFIHAVLGLHVSGRGGKSIVKVGGESVAIDSENGLIVRMEGGKFRAQNAPTMYGYAVSRKKMNTVKAKYKEFIQYAKGFMALRSINTEVIHNQGTPYELRFYNDVIHISTQEAVDALGTIPREEVRGIGNNPNTRGPMTYVDTKSWSYSMHLPQEHSKYDSARFKDVAPKQMEALMRLCASDQPEEDKHANFHKAIMVLLTYTQWIPADEDDLTNVRAIRDKDVVTLFTHVMKRHHRADYLERIEMKDGALPNATYDLWMREV